MEEHWAHCVTTEESPHDSSVRLEVQSFSPRGRDRQLSEFKDSTLSWNIECDRDDSTEEGQAENYKLQQACCTEIRKSISRHKHLKV